jgi:hypothetical protein
MSDQATPTTRPMTAVFPLVRDAVAFVARLSEEPGKWWYVDGSLKLTGKTVTWTADERATAHFGEYVMDMLGTVGYYGSAPTGRKATLNGIKAPASY